MRVTINPFKNLQENAQAYFEKAKKAKAKLKGLNEAMLKMQEKIENISIEKQEKVLEKKRKKEWFEKFHWFFTSQNNLLCLAGKDVQTNELLIKKYMQETDLYFHAEIQGAAHCILKEGKTKANTEDKKEAAIFAGVFSKAWNSGISNVDVYCVFPEQVSKQAKSGESLSSGAFMIYGEREWFKKTPLEFAVGIQENGRIISGPPRAVRKTAKVIVTIEFGNENKSKVAKKLQKIFEKKTGVKVSIDEIMAMIPPSSKIQKIE